MTLHKTFEIEHFFEATDEVATLIPELGRLFPVGPVIGLKSGRQTALAEPLLKQAAWHVFEGTVTGSLFISRCGLSHSNGFFRADYHATGKRIQATISVNAPQFTLAPTRGEEIRERALALGWEDAQT